jgi:hypothetical protein
MVLNHRNAMIFHRNFFSDGQSPTVAPSKFFTLDVKGKFARLGFCAVSTTYRYRSVDFFLATAGGSKPAIPKGPSRFFYQISALTNVLDLSSEDHSSASAANRRSSSSSTNGDRPRRWAP